MYAKQKTIAQQENGAGEFIETTADLSPNVHLSTLPKALFGPVVANLSWMHAHFVANHVLGYAREKESCVTESIRTIVIRTTTFSTNFALNVTIVIEQHLFVNSSTEMIE